MIPLGYGVIKGVGIAMRIQLQSRWSAQPCFCERLLPNDTTPGSLMLWSNATRESLKHDVGRATSACSLISCE